MEFRKKPVVIEAIQWPGTKFETSPPEWFTKAMYIEPGAPGFIMRWGDEIVIETLEGQMRAQPGDWIIRGIKGEIYPCKPDIFAATYEDATPSPASTAGGERQSIADDPEFRRLLGYVQGWVNGHPLMNKDAENLIAHIDSWPARSADDALPAAWSYECLQPGGNGIWCEFFSREKPSADTHIRNIFPLYGAAPAPGNTAQPTAYDTMDHDQLSKLGQQQKGEHDGR